MIDKLNNCPFIVYFIGKKNWQLLQGGITEIGEEKFNRKEYIMLLFYIFFLVYIEC